MTVALSRFVLGCLSFYLHDFPVEASANSLKQFPVVQPQERFARLCIHGQPATLRPRVCYNFNFAHPLLPSCVESEIVRYVSKRA